MSSDHRRPMRRSVGRWAAAASVAAATLLAVSPLAGAQQARHSSGKTAVSDDAKAPRAKRDTALTSNGEVASAPTRMVAKGIDFVGNTAELAPSATTGIAALAESINASRSRFIIEAHTDAVGTPPDLAGAQRLSTERAAAVKAALVAGGIPAGRLFAIGAGAMHPRAPAAGAKADSTHADSSNGKAAVAQQVAEAAVPGAKLLGMGWRALKAHRDAGAADSAKVAQSLNARIEVVRIR